MTKTCNAFLACAHDDEAHREELVKRLSVLKRKEGINLWHEGMVGIGEEKRQQIEEKLDAAQVIVLLVSASFLDSNWDALKEALNLRGRDRRLVPVILSICDWKATELGELKALPADGQPIKTRRDRDAAWQEVVDGLREVVKKTAAAGTAKVPPEPACRDEATRELSGRLLALYSQRETTLIAGGETGVIDREILDVRRQIRQGPVLQPGDFLGDGRYRLLEKVGQGGFAKVWKAWDVQHHKLVALKCLHGQYSEDRTRRERFFRGARKMDELAHPHVV